MVPPVCCIYDKPFLGRLDAGSDAEVSRAIDVVLIEVRILTGILLRNRWTQCFRPLTVRR